MHKRNTVSLSRPPNIRCIHCGIEYHAPPSQIEHGRKFCSHSCRSVFMASTNKGKKTNKPSWNRLGEKPLTQYERVKRYLSKKREKAGQKQCACGCGELIPALTAQGKPAKYKVGHQPGHMETTFKKGRQTWNKGVFGILSHSFVHGMAFAPYPIEFNRTLREKIRTRDNHTCQLCGIVWETGKRHTVHHIDYNKSNCSETNLITLCNSCNLRVNFNRATWTQFFSEKIKSII